MAEKDTILTKTKKFFKTLKWRARKKDKCDQKNEQRKTNDEGTKKTTNANIASDKLRVEAEESDNNTALNTDNILDKFSQLKIEDVAKYTLGDGNNFETLDRKAESKETLIENNDKTEPLLEAANEPSDDNNEDESAFGCIENAKTDIKEEEEEDEEDKFIYSSKERTGSVSSDSGYNETNLTKVAQKKKKIVTIPRGPINKKAEKAPLSRPYPPQNQVVNPNSLSGGQVYEAFPNFNQLHDPLQFDVNAGQQLDSQFSPIYEYSNANDDVANQLLFDSEISYYEHKNAELATFNDNDLSLNGSVENVEPGDIEQIMQLASYTLGDNLSQSLEQDFIVSETIQDNFGDLSPDFDVYPELPQLPSSPNATINDSLLSASAIYPNPGLMSFQTNNSPSTYLTDVPSNYPTSSAFNALSPNYPIPTDPTNIGSPNYPLTTAVIGDPLAPPYNSPIDPTYVGSPCYTSPAAATSFGSPNYTSPAVSTSFGSPNYTSPAVSTSFGSPNYTSPAVSTSFGSPNYTSPAVSTSFGSPNYTSPAVSTSFGSPNYTSPAVSTSFGSPNYTSPAVSTYVESPFNTSPTSSTNFGSPNYTSTASTNFGSPSYTSPPASTNSGSPNWSPTACHLPDKKLASPKEQTPNVKKNLAYYKGVMNKLRERYANAGCCKKEDIRELFHQEIQKLSAEKQAEYIESIARIPVSKVFGFLKLNLDNIASEYEQSKNFLYFYKLCDMVLDLKPEWYLEDFGETLLQIAVIRCYKYPFITKYLIRNIYNAFLRKGDLNHTGPLFTETVKNNNTLPIECAQRGDSHALVLSALIQPPDPSELSVLFETNSEEKLTEYQEYMSDEEYKKLVERSLTKERVEALKRLPPLYDLYHKNQDHRNALHVACRTLVHEEPRLHTVHVLLRHGKMRHDEVDHNKETALHHAVMPKADANLVLMLFAETDRNDWHGMVHFKANDCSKTPGKRAVEYSTSRDITNYPDDIENFFKTCRKDYSKKNTVSISST